MTYSREICREYEKLIRKYPDRNKLIPKCKSRHLAKLRRYIAMVRGEHIPNQKWLWKLFEGRHNRTPWKPKGVPYIAKAKRSPFGFATGGYVNAVEMDIHFPNGVVLGRPLG